MKTRREKHPLTMPRFFNKQLSNNNIDFDVFPLIFNRNLFDFKKYFASFIEFNVEEYDAGIIEPVERLDEFKIRLRKKAFKKRFLGQIDLTLSSKNKIGVKLLSVIRKITKPTSIPILKESSQLLKKITWNSTEIPEGSIGNMVQPEDIGKFLDIGDEVLTFEDNELKCIKDLTIENFTLVGFKDRSALKPYHNLKEPLLVVPDDKRVLNSSIAIDALVSQMIELNKIGIAKVKLNSVSSVKFCALLPQEEVKENNNIKVPCGFQLIYLPYMDDIRKLDPVYPSNTLVPNNKDISVAIDFVENLTIAEFNPQNFENPNIQKFYNSLQSLALNEKINNEIKDYLEPDYEGLAAKADVIERFKSHFESRINEQGNNGFNSLDTDKSLKNGKSKKKVNNEKKPVKIEEKEMMIEEGGIFIDQEEEGHQKENRSSRMTDILLNSLKKIEDKVKAAQYNQLKVSELDFYLENKHVLPDKKVNKAEKLRLIEQYMKENN